MKKLGVLLCVMALAGSAFATTFTFTSNDGRGDPDDIMDLDHSSFYSWEVRMPAIPAGEQIVSARLTFNDIYNSVYEPYNVIHVDVLDSLPAGGTAVGTNLRRFPDNQAAYVDNFAGLGTFAGELENIPYDNPYTLPAPPDLTLTFSDAAVAALSAYAADGLFWIGIDPDCHFFNTGVTLTIETAPAPVPEPATLSLLGLGLFGLFGLRKRAKE